MRHTLQETGCCSLCYCHITELLILEGTSGDHLAHPPCSKQGQLQHVARSCVQLSFEYLQGPRLHNLSGHNIPVLSPPHSENIFSYV